MFAHLLQCLRRIGCVALGWLCAATLAHAGNYGYNLVVNGDAEAVPLASTGQLSFPGWTSDNVVTINAYGWGNWAYPTTPGPDSRGNNFFFGGKAASSQAWQRIDLNFAGPDIDAGKVIYDFSAWIGGYENQADAASVGLGFLDAAGQPLPAVTPVLGPVSTTDRNGTTQALPRAVVDVVPPGARAAVVLMAFNRSSGTDSDGYIDDVSLVLSLPPGTASAAASCPAVLNGDLSLDIGRFDLQGNALGGRMQLAAGADGSLTGTMTDIYPTRKTGCPANDVGAVILKNDGGWVLHIPTVALGQSRYWTQFGIEPTPAGDIRFRLLDAGTSLPHETGQGSAFRALSKPDTFQRNGNRFSYRLVLPDGSAHQVSINLTPGQTSTPTPEAAAVIGQLGSRAWGLTSQYTTTASGYQLTARYFVPSQSLPADVIAQIRSQAGLASAIARESKAATTLDGVAVEINSAGSALGLFGKEGVSKLVEKGFTEVAGKTVGQNAGNVFDVAEAFSAVKQHMNWDDRMTQAERCLNATITDPTVKQQIGSAVTQARHEVNVNAGVNYFSMLASKAIGAIETGVPLFIATGLMTDYVSDAMKSVNESRVQEVERASGRCDHRWRVEFAGSGTYTIDGPDGLDYTSPTRKTAVSYNWKITRNKVVFKDNTRGTQTPIYGKNHVIDYMTNSRTITGSYARTLKGPDIDEVCQGEVYNAVWESGGMEITDNLSGAYPPTPEFYVKIPGFTGVRWRGTCVTNGRSSSVDSSVTLGIPVRARFDMPADFRSNPVNQAVAGTDVLTTSALQKKTTQWSGAVTFTPY